MVINQDFINKVKKAIMSECETETDEYYGILRHKYVGIEEFLEEVQNPYDKIAIAQWAKNYELADAYIKKLNLDEYTSKKYNALQENNGEINQTIDLRILSPEYSFLDDILDMLTAEIEVQEQILSLSKEKLEIFKELYARINENLDYANPQISALLNRLGTITPYTYWKNLYHKYPELENSIIQSKQNGNSLDNEEIDNLLYIYLGNIAWNVTSKEELKQFSTPAGIFNREIDNLINKERIKDEKDITKIKTALLLKSYGIDYKTAFKICNMYNIQGLEVTDDNKDLLEMYKAILRIVTEKDANNLLSVYDAFSKEMSPKPDFMRTIVFENALRREYAKNIRTSLYKLSENYIVKDGVPVYDVPDNFKMVVTSIGAYQGSFDDKENYSDYWNSPKIVSHGNCCSLIGNDNLSMAEPKNVIFGFNSMSDSMLLMENCKDMNSTILSRRFNIANENTSSGDRTIEGYKLNAIDFSGDSEFFSPNKLIDYTRSDYNELVYERRDLSQRGQNNKKNPDYIVYIEEYEDIFSYFEKYKEDEKVTGFLNEQMKMQEHRWKESIKAAKDFGIPIVRINREKCAKKSLTDIESMLKEFASPLNSDLIEKIICKYENNRVGNTDFNKLIREKYFSKQRMETCLKTIENIISSVPNPEEHNKLLETYSKAIETEESKVEPCDFLRNKGQTSGIDFVKVKERIAAMSAKQRANLSGMEK